MLCVDIAALADHMGIATAAEALRQIDEYYSDVNQRDEAVSSQVARQLDMAARQRYASRVRRWREKTGLSLRAFARLVGTSASRLSDYERGKVAPTTDVLGRIEQVAKANRHEGS